MTEDTKERIAWAENEIASLKEAKATASKILAARNAETDARIARFEGIRARFEARLKEEEAAKAKAPPAPVATAEKPPAPRSHKKK